MEIASLIDSTYLKDDATDDIIKKVCEEAIQFGFATVCIPREFIPLAVSLLKGKKPLPITVVGFPQGENSLKKVSDAKKAVSDGAKEIDMVIALKLLHTKDYYGVLKDIQGVVQAAQCPVKVIIESGILTDEEKIIASALAKAAGAAFVKTSTGLVKGATVSDVALIRRIVGNDMGVKASGGIRTYKDCLTMVEAGANRIGTSSALAILKEGGYI